MLTTWEWTWKTALSLTSMPSLRMEVPMRCEHSLQVTRINYDVLILPVSLDLLPNVSVERNNMQCCQEVSSASVLGCSHQSMALTCVDANQRTAAQLVC